MSGLELGPNMKQHSVRILGIDPGLRRTGWGVIESEGSSLRFIGSGTVKSVDKAPLAIRLTQLFQGLERGATILPNT